jgi:hypothetical protein
MGLEKRGSGGMGKEFLQIYRRENFRNVEIDLVDKVN